MKTHQFKTTIKCTGCVRGVTPFLDETAGAENWEVDLTHPSRVLTVKSDQPAEAVVRAVEQAGFKAEPL
jgi:copper chaperone CopZ